MTPRKTREARVRATEDAVFGYRATRSRGSMNSEDEPDEEDDLLTDGEPIYETCTVRITVGALRKAIKEALKGSN